MSQRTGNLSKLLKKYRNPKTKSSKSKTKRTKTTRVLPISHLKKKIKEETAINDFLRQAEEITDSEQLILMTKKFAGSSTDPYYRQFRQKLFFGPSGIVTLLTPTEYEEFIVAFNNQPAERVIRQRGKGGAIVETTVQLQPKGVVEFWEWYNQQPKIKTAIEKRIRQKERDAEAERKLREAVDELESDEEVDEFEESKSNTPPPPPPPPRATKKPRSTIMVEMVTDAKGKPVLGKDGKPVLRPITPVENKPRKPTRTDPYEDKCVREQRSAPWIEEGKVRGCYVLAIPESIQYQYGNKKDSVKVRISTGPYADQTKPFYRAQSSFYKLLCNRQSGRNEQEDQVLHTRTASGESISFYVAYLISQNGLSSKPSLRERNAMKSKGWKWSIKHNEWEKILVQDQRMAAQKEAWYLRTREDRTSRMERILDGPVTPTLMSIGSRNLVDTQQDVGTGGVLETFSQEASEDISNETKTAREYITRLSTILAYLTESEVFRTRVSEGWYSPNTFISLTPKQMLPFSKIDDDSPESRSNASILVARQTMIASRIAKLYYQLEHPTERIPTRPNTQIFGRTVQMDEWRNKCVNKEDIIEVPDYRLVTYEESGKIYCLDMHSITQQIKQAMLFENDRNELIINQEGDLKNPYTDKPLREDFLRAIVDNFDNIDWEDDSEDEETEDETVEEKVPTPPTPPERMLAPGLIDLVLSNIEECKRELQEDDLEDGKCPALDRTEVEGEDTESDESSSSEDETDDESVPPPPSKMSPPMGEKCESCGKAVNPDTSFKTKRHNSKGSYDTCHFCPGEECMSNTKFKFKKGGKKSGKKGGRQRTDD